MAEDQGKEEEKFDFTPEGEGYISLDEARVLAMRTAVASPGEYGSQYQGVTMVFDVVEATETDDHYTVILSVRPQGDFLGRPGQEQFVVGKEGTIAVRQVLSFPAQTSASPASTASKGGGFPVLPVAIGLVVVGAIAAVGAVFVMMGSGGDSVPVAAVAPTETPAPTPRPTATPNASSYYNKGEEYADAENWVMAIGEYTRAIGMNPNYADAYFGRGYSYEKLDQDQNAINDYTKAIQLDPDYASAYNNRGWSYGNLGQYQQAINDFTEAIQLDPANVHAYINRGASYSELGQLQLAIDDFTTAIQLDPDDALAYNNRGSAYNNQTPGQYQLAINDFTKAIQLDPDDALAYNNRGISYDNLGQPTLADADATMACSLDSQWC